MTIEYGRWKPIDTCPKDPDEKYIVGCDIASVWLVRSAFYISEDEADKDWQHGWWSNKHSVTTEHLSGIYEPTHWLCEANEPYEMD